MAIRLFLRISLFFFIPLLVLGGQKEKKAYELIYQDVQILKQQVLELDKKIGSHQEELQTIKQQMGEKGGCGEFDSSRKKRIVSS